MVQYGWTLKTYSTQEGSHEDKHCVIPLYEVPRVVKFGDRKYRVRQKQGLLECVWEGNNMGVIFIVLILPFHLKCHMMCLSVILSCYGSTYLRFCNKKYFLRRALCLEQWVPEAGAVGGSYQLLGTEFQLYKMKRVGGRWCWWLQNNMNVLNTSELYT